MKKFSAILLIAGMCLFQACNSNTTTQDNADSSSNMDDQNTDTSTMMNNTDTSSAMGGMAADKDASDFAMEAAKGGMMEVQLGQHAQQNAMNQRVKDFGAMLVQDHSQASDKLKSLASSKNITLPASVDNDKMDDMSDLIKKKGKDFDKAYMNMMVKDHKKDISNYQKAANDLNDQDLRNFAAQTLPTLQKHLDSAQAIIKANKY